jgi:hypothetical protein
MDNHSEEEREGVLRWLFDIIFGQLNPAAEISYDVGAITPSMQKYKAPRPLPR